MRTTTSICALGLFCTMASFGIAQEGPEQYSHLKELESYIGEWTGKYDPPGDAPLGTVRIRCSWISNKSHFLANGFYTPDGVEDFELNPSNIVIGYNGKTKSPYSWHFDLGGQMHGPAKITKGKVEMKIVERIGLDGSVETRDSSFELNEKGKMVIKHFNRIRDDEKLPDDPPLVLIKSN